MEKTVKQNVSVLNKIRSVLGRIMQRAELPIRLAVKYFAFLFLFRMVSNAEIFASVEQTGLLQNSTVQMVLALAATLLPNRCGVFIAFALVTYNVFQVSLLGSVIVGLVLMLFYVIAASLFPDEVYLIVLIPLCIQYHWLLAVPLAAGMYIGAIAVVPVIVGVLVYGFWNIIPLFMELKMDGSLDGIPKLITEASENGLNVMMNDDSLVYLMVIFAAIIVVTALIRVLHVNFSRYIALAAGSIFGLAALMIGASKGNISGVSIAWNSVITIAVMLVLELFKVPLSYKSAQVLEFEDDEYVYKVRMIPKMGDRGGLQNTRTKIATADERSAISRKMQEDRQQMIREQKEAAMRASAVSAGTDMNGGIDMGPVPDETGTYQGDLNGANLYPPRRDMVNPGYPVEGYTQNVQTAPVNVQPTQAVQPMPGAAPGVPQDTQSRRSVLADDREDPTDLFNEYDQNHQ